MMGRHYWKNVDPQDWQPFADFVRMVQKVLWPTDKSNLGHLVATWTSNETWDDDLADIMIRSGSKKKALNKYRNREP